MRGARSFLWLSLFLVCSACSVSVDFTQEIHFDVASPGSGSFSTNFSHLVTSDDVRSFLKESGYVEKDFKSISVKSVYLYCTNKQVSLNPISSFSLHFSYNDGGMKAMHHTDDLYVGADGKYYFTIDKQELLKYYQNSPFYVKLAFTAYGLSSCTLSLYIDGTIEVETH